MRLASSLALMALVAGASAPVWAGAARSSAAAPAASPKPPDVYFLANGDRVSGRTLSKNPRGFVLRTPYGRVTLPRDQVARVVWGDGREELLRPDAEPIPAHAATLIVLVGGRTFWQAWDRRDTVDGTLRFRLFLDGQPLATYTDVTLDPRDLPGATVNTFAFDPQRLQVAAYGGAWAAPPDTRPGQAALRVAVPVPPESTGAARHALRLAYEANVGTREAHDWRELAAASLDVDLDRAVPTRIEVTQDAGRMEFSGFTRKRMKHGETFRLDAVVVAATATRAEPPGPP